MRMTLRPTIVPLAALLACQAPPGLDDVNVPGERSCEQTSSGYTVQRPVVDVLLVVDTSPAMATHREQWIETLGTMGALLGDNGPDMRIGVVSSDVGDSGCVGDGARFVAEPQIDGCAPPDGPYIIDETEPWYVCGERPGVRCPIVNYQGPLDEVLACIGALPADGCADAQPLRAAHLALSGAQGRQFRRPDAMLWILVVAAGDDRSPGSVHSYADEWEASTERIVALSVLAPPTATRLRTATEHATHALFVPVDAGEWTDALEALFTLFAHPLPLTCLAAESASDSLDRNPGLQPECVVSEGSWGDGPLIPACQMSSETRPAPDTPRPCWWIEPTDEYGDDCLWVKRTEGVEWSNWRCEALCE